MSQSTGRWFLSPINNNQIWRILPAIISLVMVFLDFFYFAWISKVDEHIYQAACLFGFSVFLQLNFISM